MIRFTKGFVVAVTVIVACITYNVYMTFFNPDSTIGVKMLGSFVFGILSLKAAQKILEMINDYNRYNQEKEQLR